MFKKLKGRLEYASEYEASINRILCLTVDTSPGELAQIASSTTYSALDVLDQIALGLMQGLSFDEAVDAFDNCHSQKIQRYKDADHAAAEKESRFL